MFKSKNEKNTETDKLTACLSGMELLQRGKLSNLLIEIRSLVSCPDKIFRQLYLSTIYRLAEFCQAMPFSINDFNHLYGFVERQLRLSIAALKLRRGILLPKNASTEQISTEEAQWTYAIFTAGLLKDLYQLQSNRNVVLHHANGDKSGNWLPLTGSLFSKNVYYKMDFTSGNNKINVDILMAAFSGRIIPPEAIDWLYSNSYLFKQWWNTILNHQDQENEIEKIIITAADKASIKLIDRISEIDKPDLLESFTQYLISNIPQDSENIFRINEGIFVSSHAFEDFLSENSFTSKNTFFEELMQENWLILNNENCIHELHSKKYEDKRIFHGIILNIDYMPKELQQLPITTLFQTKPNKI